MSTKELILFLWALMLTVAFTAVSLKLYQMPGIASVDLQGIVKQFSRDVSEKHLSERNVKQLTNAFSDRLVSVTEAYAADRHVVIVVSPAVVSGARDVTQEIQEDIYRALSSER